MSYATAAVGAGIAFLTGTAAHELTHAVVADGLGARVESVRPLPPAPRVVYQPPSAQVDRAIRVAPIILSLPLLVAVMFVAAGRPLREQVVLAAFVAAYIPRSRSDWAPVAGLF